MPLTTKTLPQQRRQAVTEGFDIETSPISWITCVYDAGSVVDPQPDQPAFEAPEIPRGLPVNRPHPQELN